MLTFTGPISCVPWDCVDHTHKIRKQFQIHQHRSSWIYLQSKGTSLVVASTESFTIPNQHWQLRKLGSWPTVKYRKGNILTVINIGNFASSDPGRLVNIAKVIYWQWLMQLFKDTSGIAWCFFAGRRIAYFSPSVVTLCNEPETHEKAVLSG